MNLLMVTPSQGQEFLMGSGISSTAGVPPINFLSFPVGFVVAICLSIKAHEGMVQL